MRFSPAALLLITLRSFHSSKTNPELSGNVGHPTDIPPGDRQYLLKLCCITLLLTVQSQHFVRALILLHLNGAATNEFADYYIVDIISQRHLF